MRQIFTYFLLPVLIAIVAGVFLYHYPRYFEDPKGLFFVKDQFLGPSVNDTTYQFNYVKVSNETGDIQEDVVITLSSDTDMSSLEVTAESNEAKSLEFSIENKADATSIRIPVLRVGETASFQTLLRADDLPRINVTVNSRTNVGELYEPNGIASRWELLAWVWKVVKPILMALALLLLLRIFRGVRHSKNDTGFVLYHMGDTKRAREVLEKSLVDQGASVYELTNLACCLADDGDAEASRHLIDAAILLNNGEEHDNILLAEAIYFFRNGELEKSKDYLSKFRAYRHFYLFSSHKRYRGSKVIAEMENTLS